MNKIYLSLIAAGTILATLASQALAEDQVEVKRVVVVQNILQGNSTIKPKANKSFVWVEISIGQLSQLPATLDLTTVRLKDTNEAEQEVLGVALGKRTDAKPFIDYFIGAPDTVDTSGPYGAAVFVSTTIEGPNVGKVEVKVDVTNKKANLTFHKAPSVLCLLFAVPKDPGELAVTNVFGKSLKIQSGKSESMKKKEK